MSRFACLSFPEDGFDRLERYDRAAARQRRDTANRGERAHTILQIGLIAAPPRSRHGRAGPTAVRFGGAQVCYCQGVENIFAQYSLPGRPRPFGPPSPAKGGEGKSALDGPGMLAPTSFAVSAFSVRRRWRPPHGLSHTLAPSPLKRERVGPQGRGEGPWHGRSSCQFSGMTRERGMRSSVTRSDVHPLRCHCRACPTPVRFGREGAFCVRLGYPLGCHCRTCSGHP